MANIKQLIIDAREEALKKRASPDVMALTRRLYEGALSNRQDQAYRLVRDWPGITTGDLSGRLGVSVREASNLLAVLRQGGLVYKEGRGWWYDPDN